MRNDWLETFLRLGAAVIAGGAVGWERQLGGRPAGLRTHMLVSLGAALVVLIPLSSGFSDTTRVIQGVATGIGFLCAGDILHQVRDGHERVKGLTSAAALWVTAAIGMVAASGLWPIVVVGTALTLLILTVFRWVEPKHDQPKGDPPRGDPPKGDDKPEG